MALISTKLAVATILANFNVEMSEGLPHQIEFDPVFITPTPIFKLNLKFSERA
jgi:hypothetical protein